jgi:membrane-associated phospholipid phosphatase
VLFFTVLLALCGPARSQAIAGPNPEPSSQPSLDLLPDAPQPPAAPQPQSADPAQPISKPAVTLRTVPIDIVKDEAAIWTSPIRVRERNFPILIPLVLATTLAITTDHQAMNSSKLQNASLNSHANTASNGLLGGFVIAPVAIYGIGYLHHDSHATETGILAGEAMVHSLVVDEVLKAVTMRERPTLDNAQGKFFQSSVGLDSSFPSTHSIIAWSSATVIASEYPGPLTQITAYGLATGVSLTRVLAKQHFPSDVLVGSAVGWMIGRYIVHKHHRDDY